MSRSSHNIPLYDEIRQCRLCEELPLGPRPIFQASPNARILIAGQAPGKITHEKAIPFDDPSGDRLRDWLGVSEDEFYNPNIFAIVPMGFCYPGRAGSGDAAPVRACAKQWREALLATMPGIRLTIILGRHATQWHLPEGNHVALTQIIEMQELSLPKIVLPHPSPRNNPWLKANPWFEKKTLPALKQRVASTLEENKLSD